MKRLFKDLNLLVSKALPAAGATNNSDPIDMGSKEPAVGKFDVVVNLPALPSLVDAKTVTITLQDSADGITYAAIPELATFVVTGAGGIGAAAAERRVRLPSSSRRFLRFSQTVLAAGGDSTALSATLSLVF